MEEASWHDAAALADLDEEIGIPVRIGSTAIALFRAADRVYALDDFCPHQGSPLSSGLTRDGVLTCPLHAWQFRLSDGANVDGGPGLCAYPVRVLDGRIQVKS
ncbi:MAG: Rieske (2Fe-2S) protein [Acidobacteriota bacterium]